MLQFSLLVIAVQRIGEVQEKLRTFGQLRSQLLLDLRDKQQALTVDSRIANESTGCPGFVALRGVGQT